VALALGLCLVLPAKSWLDGSRAFAFAMFSHSRSFRVRVLERDAHDRLQPRSAAVLATRAGGPLGQALAGADRWLPSAYGPRLRAHVGELARLGCAAATGARSVRVFVDDRATLDAPVETASAEAACQ